MAEGREQKPKFVPAKTQTTRGRDGSPPPWAIGLMVAIIGFVVLMYSFPGIAYAIFPFARSDYFWIGLIFLPFVALIVVAVASAGLDFRRAQSWSETTGRIVKSQLEVRRHRFAGEAETVENVPAVEYEFSVGGRKYLGSRIGIGHDTEGANTEATLKRYTQGAAVTVYYDANDPRNCVLERGGPFAAKPVASAPGEPLPTTPKLAQGVARPSALRVTEGLIVLAAIGGGIWWLVARGPDFIEAHFPKSDPPIVIFAACFGLAALAIFIASHRYSKQAQSWPKVTGEIVRSEVESFRDTTGGRTTTMYRPAVEYAYTVGTLALRGTQIKLAMTTSGTQAYAESVVKKYPQGSTVEVHYDPANPATAALENPTGATWLVAALAAACFAFSVWQLGVFR
jgi:Protein of unknown function (DUF3592)